MKILIIYKSVHNKNTEKIAQAMAEEIGCDIKDLSELTADSESVKNILNEYDVIGFGSGIYNGKHHTRLLKFIDELPEIETKKVFIFSTATVYMLSTFHKEIKQRLGNRNFNIIDEFSCRGRYNWGIFKIFGGIGRKRPNEKDIQNAKNFIKKIASTS